MRCNCARCLFEVFLGNKEESIKLFRAGQTAPARPGCSFRRHAHRMWRWRDTSPPGQRSGKTVMSGRELVPWTSLAPERSSRSLVGFICPPIISLSSSLLSSRSQIWPARKNKNRNVQLLACKDVWCAQSDFLGGTVACIIYTRAEHGDRRWIRRSAIDYVTSTANDISQISNNKTYGNDFSPAVSCSPLPSVTANRGQYRHRPAFLYCELCAATISRREKPSGHLIRR